MPAALMELREEEEVAEADEDAILEVEPSPPKTPLLPPAWLTAAIIN